MAAKRDNPVPGDGYRLLALAQLQSLVGLEGCDPGFVRHLADAGLLLHAPRQTMIHRRGDAYEGLLLIVEGAVATGRHLGQAHAILYAYFGPGDVHGLVPLCDGGPHTHDVMAHEPSVLLRIPTATLHAALEQCPPLAAALRRQLAHRTRVTLERLHDAIAQPLSYRLAMHLGYLGRRFGNSGPQGVQISIRVSQADLAGAVGASRQQVNAELKKFEQRGLIAVSRATVVIRDAEALEAAGSGAPPMTLRRDSLAAPARRSRARRAANGAVPGPLHGLRVLVVEDDELTRTIVTAQLQQAGALVDEADDGEAAVLRLGAAAAHYDLIVMDEHMPRLSGSAATRRIRKQQAAAGQRPTPVLCVSSAASRNDSRRYAAAGMNGHLAKPFLQDELIAALLRLVR